MTLTIVQVMRNKDESITLKLGDFGLAVEVKSPIFTICGTPTYVAPEILAEIGTYLIGWLAATSRHLFVLLSLVARLRTGSGHVGCGCDHVHPAVWIPSIPQSRQKPDGALRVHQGREI